MIHFPSGRASAATAGSLSQEAPKAPALDLHLRPLRNLLHEYDFSGIEAGDRLTMTYPGNWKLTMEGAIEDYHLPLVHPELVEGEVESLPRLDYAPRCFFANSSRPGRATATAIVSL